MCMTFSNAKNKLKLVKLESVGVRLKLKSVRTLFIVTRLAHRKSYLVIICPHSHDKLTKIEIRSSSRITHPAPRKS